MGDPQCDRIASDKPDYSVWERLLRFSLRRIAAEEKDGRDGNEGPVLVVLGGDIVNRRGRESEWNTFFAACDRVRKDFDFLLVSPTGVHGSQKPYYQVPGFIDRFLLPGTGPAGYEDGCFSFDYGCVHFVVLDSNLMYDTEETQNGLLSGWIRDDLAKTGHPAAFVVMHHPMYTAGFSQDNDRRAKSMRDGFQSLLYRHGIDMILCGHEHLYCRTGEDARITQVMGVSGGKLFDTNFESKNKENMATCVGNVAVTTLFTVDVGTIKGETFDADERRIDSFSQSVRPGNRET